MGDWATRRLSDVVELRRGFDLPTRLREPGAYPVLSAGTRAGTHCEGPVKGPGFVVGRATNLGVPTWSATDYWPLNTTLYAADFKGNDPRFLFHLFESLDLSGFDSGSVQPMLNRNYIASVEVRVPPVPVQRAIAEVLGALDDKIAANAKLTGLADSLLSALFARLSIDEEPILGGVPITRYVTLNPAVPKPRGEQALYLDMKSIPEVGPSVQGWQHREPKGGARFQNGDTVMARITPCLENGKTAYVDFMGAGEIGVGSTEFIVLRSRDGVPSQLSYAMARSPRFREFAIRHMVGSSGRQRLSASDLATLQVSDVEQGALDAFGTAAEPLMARIKVAADESRALAMTRDALLPLLMSGRVRVKDAEKVVEGVV